MQYQSYYGSITHPPVPYNYTQPKKPWKCPHFIFSCWVWAIIIGIIVVLIIVMYVVLSKLTDTYDKVTCNEKKSSPAFSKSWGWKRWLNPLYAMQTGFNLTVGSITGWRPCLF